MAVRFYIDADSLGLAHVLVQIRGDVTFPGDPGGVFKRKERPPCLIAPRTKDPEWIPIVSRFGWLIITRDQHIVQRKAEIAEIMAHNGRMVAIVGRPHQRLDNFGQLEILLTNWQRIEALTLVNGPFIFAASRTGLRKIA